MVVSTLGAILGLVIAIILILKKVSPTYSMIIGAVFGGIIGGVGIENTVNFIIIGVKNISPAIIRIITAGILAGTLIESGAAEKIAEIIVKKLGNKCSLLAMTLSTTILTAVGVFGDVAIITVAPIGIQVAKRLNYKKLGILIALIGGVKAGNIISPNPNAISAAESFQVPLTSVMLVGLPSSLVAIILTFIISKYLSKKGTEIENIEIKDKKNLPSLITALVGPLVTIGILILRPLVNIIIDPLIALPLGGFCGILAMRKLKNSIDYLEIGIKKMSGVALLLIGTGALAGVIANSNLKETIVNIINIMGLPPYLLAPMAGILMGAATASATAGTSLGSQIFGPTILEYGLAPLAVAGMIHAGSFVFDGLPHGSFFHISAGSVNMEIRERLKLIIWESLIGVGIVTISTILLGVFKIVG
ncbi:GntP family permease [Fusobacterium simiae]|uniref:GntP family permease n=1 Tax=Fusobacterium simiae TaxID=855 RepID=A0ABT4DJ08_FUSSI|nr:GntP family permease [Fusobacterium simiae]MCY7008587.1 GntP family permease [Fusobacterium simiae]